MPRSKGRAGYIANENGSPATDVGQHKHNFQKYMSHLMCAKNTTYRQHIIHQREAYTYTADAAATEDTILRSLDPTVFVP
eukprot:7477839-Karenia_brevis.AAC.1